MKLLERDAEVGALRDLWGKARTGRGALVLIAGEPGAGKTALAQTFAAEAALVRGPDPVLWGTCTPLATPSPLEPLREAMHRLGGPVAELIAEDAPVHRVLAALHEQLTLNSWLLVVDDLQWSDEATVDLLRLLVRRIHTTRSLVIGTHRDEEIGLDHPLRTLIGDVTRCEAATQLYVGPLSRDAIAAIVTAPGRDPEAVLRLTGGNAFFVHEVAAAAQDGDLPATVRDAVLARTAGLSPTAHDVLALLACTPESVPDIVLPALGVDLPTLRSLDQTGLLDRGSRGLRFRHELCRMAIAEVIPPGGEVTLHARVLQALEQQGIADPAVMTHHALGAQDSVRVLRYAPEAGRRAAAAGAHTQAAAFYQAALDQPIEMDDGRRAELLEALAEELYLIDRLADAIAVSGRAMALRAAARDMLGVGSMHRALSLFEWYNADRDNAERHATAAIEVLELTRDPLQLGLAYAVEAYLAIQRSDIDAAQRYLRQADDLGDAIGDAELRLCLDVMGTVCTILAGDETARTQLLDVVAAGFRAQLDVWASSGYSNLAYVDVEQRRLAQAAEVLKTSLPLTVERDLPICHVWQLGARGRLSLLRGNWDDALRDADAVLGSNGAPVGRTWTELVRGLVELRRGEGDPGKHFDAAWELADRLREPLRILPAGAALAEQCWLTGVDDDRIDVAARVLASTSASNITEWSVGDLAVWLRRIGRAVPAGIRAAEPFRIHLAGDPAGAATLWADIGEPYEQALALVDTGADGDAFRALELLDSLGAAAVATKVRRQLRQRGVTGVPAGPRTATRANPSGLTERQLEVLALLAEGLSNAQLAERLYISPKTVDHHISAILTKLRAGSRTEAAHIARASGIIA